MSTAPETKVYSPPQSAAAEMGWRRFLNPQWLIIGGTMAFVLYFALIPLIFLVAGSFQTPRTATAPAVWTLDNYVRAYTDPNTLTLLLNSLQYAIGVAAVSFFLGTLLAWMNERTNTPLKTLFFGLSIIPLIIPGILFVVSWIFLASPEIGLFNIAWKTLTGSEQALFDIYSMWGMIWVEALHLSPLAFLMMVAAFRSMDPSLEESAMMSGANILQVVWNITLKLAWPAIFAVMLITFVRGLESFEIPAILGIPVGIKVFTSEIYLALHRYPSDFGLAGAYSVTLLMLTSLGVYWNSRMTRESHKYQTVTGKNFRPRPMDLGSWRYATAAIFLVYFALIVVLPFLVLFWSSIQPFYSVPSMEALKKATLENYAYIIEYPTALRSAWNSTLLAIGSASIVMLMTAIIAWLTVKSRVPGRWLMDNVAFLPIVFPGIVLGVSIMFVYLTLPIPIYGTIWILLVAYITRYMPYGMRYSTASMVQISKELEESAAMSGATWWTTFRRITLPLLKPGLVGGWIYVVIVSIRELSSSILLYSPGSEVISITIWELWENGQYVELSALGVMLIVGLFILVTVTQQASKRFGVQE